MYVWIYIYIYISIQIYRYICCIHLTRVDTDPSWHSVLSCVFMLGNSITFWEAHAREYVSSGRHDMGTQSSQGLHLYSWRVGLCTTSFVVLKEQYLLFLLWPFAHETLNIQPKVQGGQSATRLLTGHLLLEDEWFVQYIWWLAWSYGTN